MPDEAAGEALAFGESEGAVDLLGVVCAASGAEKARAAMHAPMMKCDLFFISRNFAGIAMNQQELTGNPSLCSPRVTVPVSNAVPNEDVAVRSRWCVGICEIGSISVVGVSQDDIPKEAAVQK